MKKLADRMIRWRYFLLLLALVPTVLLAPTSWRVSYDRSVQSLFANHNPRLQMYNQVIDEFGGDATCLIVYTDPQLLTADGMADLQQFAQQIRLQPDGSPRLGVKSVTSLAQVPRPSDPALLRQLRDWAKQYFLNTEPETTPQTLWRPLVEWFQDPKVDVNQLRQELLQNKFYTDILLGQDGQTTALIVQLDRTSMATGQIAGTLDELRQLASEAAPQPARVVGTSVMISDVYTYLDEDAWFLTTISLSVMSLTILLMFRSLRWTILPILTVQFALVWMRLLMIGFGVKLSIIGSMTTALITVIGIATTIHIAVRYQEEMDQHASKEPHAEASALLRTITHVFPAVFWTCVTTAVGFGALASSEVAPVRTYGLLMAAATAFVGLAVFLLTAGIVLWRRGHSMPHHTLGEAQLSASLADVGQLAYRHAPWAIAGVLTVLLLAGIGSSFLDVETDFTKNFRSDSQILEGYRFVEDRLGGAGVIEVVFTTPKTVTPEFLEKVRRTQTELEQIPGVSRVNGLPDLLDFWQEAMPKPSSLLPSFLAISDQTITWLQLRALQVIPVEMVRSLWNPEINKMRFLVRVREQQEVQGKRQQLEQIQQTAERELEGVAVSGLYVMLVYLIDGILGDQWSSFLWSCLGLIVALSLAFRSWRLGLIAFVPNLVPIIVVLGTMGWLGLKINVATAMIGSISMGLVVDFSIHYLLRFQHERKHSADVLTAIARTNRSTGKAMVFANIALMLGFSLLATSNFVPAVHFGLLVSIAILGGLIGNLILMPVMLQYLYRDEK